jgi:mannan endo-1,4-beta-mannosidase
MAEYIGKSLLGRNFVQDTNSNFIKIDGVAIGESSQFGYNTQNGQIGDLVNTALGDSNIVVIVYDWANSVGYFKSGFDYKNPSDSNSDNKADFTSYIIKSRAPALNPVSAPIPILVPQPIPTPVVQAPVVPSPKSLVGQKLYNQTFNQDTNQAYVNIVGVVLGNSNQFGHDVKNGDISTILNDTVGDSTGFVILYDNVNKVAYRKSGFNLSDPDDSSLAPNFTTYILQSKVSQQNLDFFMKGSKVSQNVSVNGFVKTNGASLELNGKPFKAVGFNAFFMGLLQETGTYPSHAQVTEVMIATKKLNANTIRSHTLGCSSQSQNALLNADNSFNQTAFEIIDFALLQAKRYSIKLVLPLTDAYNYYNGSYQTFCNPDGTPKDQFFTAPGPRQQFKNYISKFLNHVNQYTGVAIKDSIEVGFIELGNELGNIRPSSTSTAIPTQEWLNDITTFIKTIDKNHIILDGTDEALGSTQSNDFAVANIDCYSGHFYWQDWNRLNNGINSAKAANKPYIIGEYDSGWNNTWYNALESNSNVWGSLAWSIYPHDDGTENGNRVPHGDGYTIWYDNKDSTNTSKLTFLRNHFRRMQGLGEIANPFI